MLGAGRLVVTNAKWSGDGQPGVRWSDCGGWVLQLVWFDRVVRSDGDPVRDARPNRIPPALGDPVFLVVVFAFDLKVAERHHDCDGMGKPVHLPAECLD